MNKSPKPHKLVIVLQDLEFGGTQRYAINLLQHIDRSIFTPELWVLRGGMDMASLAEQTGARVKWFSKGGRVNPLTLYHFFRYLACNRPTYLYSLTAVPNIWSRIFGSFFAVPVIISSYRSLHTRQWERLLWPLSSLIICNAEAIKTKMIELHKVDSRRISVIANGVDIDYYQPSPGEKVSWPVLLFSGRFVDVKDPLTALRAFQIVLDTIPEARMVMIGNGKMFSKLKKFIRRESLAEYVALLPGTVEVRKYLHNSWVLLMSSLCEGSPNMLLEAMACGLPVVATRVGGIPEFIEHGTNGFLVPPGDPALLADYAIKLLRNEQLRVEMGNNARKSIVNNHNLQDCVRLTEKVLLDQAENIGWDLR
ncbi:MAG: glycosyltransferase [Proteobacteria bacterium]|nr:glycosyltransferase [Pseudomonadota bacterium]